MANNASAKAPTSTTENQEPAPAETSALTEPQAIGDVNETSPSPAQAETAAEVANKESAKAPASTTEHQEPAREAEEQPEELVVVKLAHEYMQEFLKLGSWIFTWQPKKSLRKSFVKVCVVEVTTGLVGAIAKLDASMVVDNFATLRSLQAFRGASQLQKTTWRNRDWSVFSTVHSTVLYLCLV